MKFYLLILFSLISFATVTAQEKHFIFIQSDNNQIFNVAINGKMYSSTASGYVIIPKLENNAYNLTVGFADKAVAEQSFHFNIDGKDLGFNLKNFGEKGYGLFNLQTLDVTYAGASGTDNVSKALAAKKELEQEPVISFADKKDVSASGTGVSAPDSAVVKEVAPTRNKRQKKDKKATAPIAAKGAIVTTPAPSSGAIKKVSETPTTGGVSISYTDASGKATDTIQVEIPTGSAGTSEIKRDVVTKQGLEPGNASVPAAKKDEPKFLDVDMTKNDTSAITKTSVSENKPVKPECAVASDDDYVKLRRKMALENTDDKMIRQAKNFFKGKCFTTRQIKSLSTLFLSDEGRYRFFSSSYSFVVDPAHFSSLESEFIDQSFAKRFRSILE